MVDMMYCLTNLLVFHIPLLYYVNLNSSIICSFFFWGYISLFFISVSSKLFCECNILEDFQALVILSAVLLPTNSSVASAFF